ncbi:organic cation transporter protein isoform X2 [Lingula anatina]|uniref:Organic cation transporter protein isoform X2 n=1 Tax=Lingula anatina TaxID=7574 RepID=A0A2R2MQ18_LINAN|nr:organic cation transporter protein isoform X2 [Lingula anatina]|eukprot:XP_023932335.1 organic cation transporter protein isoform X2 [Lingula anatina]
MKFDEILEHIGEFGRSQAWILCLLCIPQISCAWQIVVVVFLQETPDHRCSPPALLNDTFLFQNPWHEALVNQTIPINDKDGGYDKCSYYRQTDDGNTTEAECDTWVYDTSVFSKTFPMDFQLVCKDSSKVRSIQVIFLSAVLVGSIIGGILADYCGRKPVFIVACLLHGSAGVAAAFSPNYTAFATFRFLVGLASPNIFASAMVLALELVGPSRRMVAGLAPEFAWCTGLVLLTPLAYLIRDWRYLQLAVSVPSFLYISLWWLIPESPRWLLIRGHTERAEKILRWAAKVNKKTLPANIFDEKTLEKTEYVSPLEMRKTPRLLLRTLIGMFVFFVIALVWYGLALNPGTLAGDLFVNYFLMAITEYPAYCICFVINKLGRRWPHAISMMVAGVAMISTIFVELYAQKGILSTDVAQTSLFMLGKTGITTAFAIFFMWSGEFSPTPLRNFVVGMCNVSGRVGAVFAPLIVEAFEKNAQLGNTIPWIIFGVMALLAGISSLFLPETRNKQLPETLMDANDVGVKPTGSSLPDPAHGISLMTEQPPGDLKDEIMLQDKTNSKAI